MDMLENMRSFLTVAKAKSFTAAAEELGLAASVVTKRVLQLEQATGTTLLTRTTRKVALSPDGEYHYKRISEVVTSYDDALLALRKGQSQLEGLIRIKVPTTLGFLQLNAVIKSFVEQNPMVDVEILLLDGPLNPRAESIDIAITAFPASFDGVADYFLWPLTRKLVASKSYFENAKMPTHPRELSQHRCIVFQPTGQSWTFLGPNGIVSVSVPAHICSNDMNILLEAVKDSMGIGLLTTYVTSQDLNSHNLVEVLPDFPTSDIWVKAMIPTERATLPRVIALLEHLKNASVPKETEKTKKPNKSRTP